MGVQCEVIVPLTADQRQRLAVLYATRNALHVGELDVWDVIRAAHWVWDGHDMPVAQSVRGMDLGPDAATWSEDPEQVPPRAVDLDDVDGAPARRPRQAVVSGR